MQFTFSTLALLSLLGSATASIYNISLPLTVSVHTPFNVTLLTQGGSQPSNDIVVAVGIYPAPGLQGSLGQYKVATYYLKPFESNVNRPIVFRAALPVDLPGNGKYTVTGTVFSLVGSYNTPSVNTFTETVTVTGF